MLEQLTRLRIVPAGGQNGLMGITSSIAEEENQMKFSSDTANKTIKNLQAEIDTLLSAEERDKTYSYGVSEEPVKPTYSFAETQKQLKELRDKVAVLRHAVNKFNISTTLEGFGFTVDEALGRKAACMHCCKCRRKPVSVLTGAGRRTLFAGTLTLRRSKQHTMLFVRSLCRSSRQSTLQT